VEAGFGAQQKELLGHLGWEGGRVVLETEPFGFCGN
jgi:hypothetical protein